MKLMAVILWSLFVVMFSSAEAASRTWRGGNNANWNGWFSWGFFTPYPDGTGDEAVFNSGSGVNVNGNYTVNALRFLGTSNTLNNGKLTLQANSGNATLFVTNAAAPTINSDLVLGSDLSLIHGGTGVLTINGVISGTNDITKTGSGTVVLNGSNSYTGTTTIDGGVVIVTDDNALGATNGGTIVTTNGALHLSNNITINDSLTLAGSGGGIGALRSIGGTNTYAGAITLTNTTRINTDTGLFTISGNINGSNNNLTIGGTGNTIVSGSITNSSGSLTKNGAGTLTLSGSNSYTGVTTIGAGVLIAANNNALGATNNGTVVSNGAALYLSNNITVSGESLQLGGTGISNTGALRNVSGTNTWTGPLSLSAASRINADTNTQLTVSGNINGSNNNLTVGGDGNTILSGSITNSSGSLTKDGAGTVTLSGSNSYTGVTTVGTGVLIAAHNNALGATNNGTVVSNGAALYLSNNITIAGEALNLTGMGISNTGALRSINGTNAYTGLITATNAATALGAATNTVLAVSNINSGSQQLWVVGEGTTIIAGGATNSGGGTNFVKTNSGTAVLMSSNAWSGDEYIRQGTVMISNNNALGAGGTTYLGTSTATNPLSATLQLGAGITNSNAITVLADGNASHRLSYQEGSGQAAQLGGVTLKSNNLNINVKTGGTLLFGGNVTANASSGNEARLIIDGGGTVIATNNGVAPTNNYYQVRVGAGTLVIGSGSLNARTNIGGVGHGIDLGIGENWTVASGPSALLASNGVTVSNSVFVYATNGASRTLGLSGTGTTTFTGPVGLNNTALTVTADPNGTAIFNGNITNFAGSTNNQVIKTGAGTVVLGNTTNNYGGATIISNGTLNVWLFADSGVVSSIGTNGTLILAGSNSSSAVLDYAGTNVAMNRHIVATNGGGTINMATTNTVVTLTGSADGPGTLEIGKGTLVLSNTGTPNSFSPSAIKVGSGATLQLAANNQIGDSTGLILNGGTLITGTSSERHSETLGTLTLSANSTIDLGSWNGDSNTLQFADSSSITWAPGAILTIANWQGTPYTPSTISTILFGSAGLTAGQLAQIQFANQGNLPGGFIGNELVPVPEPRVYASAAALLAAIGWRERRRLKQMLGKCFRFPLW